MALNRLEQFHGQPAVSLYTAGGDRATVLLHGAQVVSWTPAGGGERFFLSERSAYGSGKTVRGGVPVVFPQFNLRGPDFSLPKHGIVRTRAWRIDEEPHSGAVDDPSTARFRLEDDEATRALWPHGFALTLTVSLGPRKLDMALEVRNPGSDAFAFTAALHSYLQVPDIAQVSVSGLRGVRYLDTVTDSGGVGADAPLTFEAETDRIYYDVPGPLMLESPESRLGVAMEGFRDAVVWNPWAGLCATLHDMAPDGYRRMVCVEAAVIDKPVRLEAGGSWLGRQTLTAS